MRLRRDHSIDFSMEQQRHCHNGLGVAFFSRQNKLNAAGLHFSCIIEYVRLARMNHQACETVIRIIGGRKNSSADPLHVVQGDDFICC